jgi:hydrogenase maturation protease
MIAAVPTDVTMFFGGAAISMPNSAANRQMKEELLVPTYCRHNVDSENPCGLALVSIGNNLRTDDGVAAAVCKALPKPLLDHICTFDLGPYTYFLVDCLAGHKAAIVVDATWSAKQAGAITVIDLTELIRTNSPIKLSSSHGLSLVDELRIGARRHLIPDTVIFLGIEGASTDWGESLSNELATWLPDITAQVKSLVEAILKDGQHHA